MVIYRYMSYLQFKENKFLVIMQIMLLIFVTLGMHEMIELIEIMRQKKTNHLLNFWIDLKTGSQTDGICCIKYRSISLLDSNYPSDALHIWAENIPVDQPNNAKLTMIPKPMFTLPQINILTMSINKILTEHWQEENLKLVDLVMIFI